MIGAQLSTITRAPQAQGAPLSAEQRKAIFRPLADDIGYLRPPELALVESAYDAATTAHEGQVRMSGEPYITHPVAVARMLAAWHLDQQAIAAALLHDAAEDTALSLAEIEKRFGRAVRELVDGVSKLDRIEFASREAHQAASFRKMVLAMARDVRVVLIKLADRLHNMRTLGAVPREKQERIARETLEIYAPIAHRLGLAAIYYELEDLGLAALHPHRFQVLEKALKKARGNRREVVSQIKTALLERLKNFGVNAQISGREKHISSIYKKMQEKSLAFAEVLDIYGFRVVVDDVKACYLALGALHTLYKPIPGKFKDYIAIPKANGYQSLHTTLFGPYGMPVEIQIRTGDMHRLSETGIASHWLYKHATGEVSEMQVKTHQWLKSLLDMQAETGDPLEFFEHVKVDLFPDEVYVFSPKGKIFALPRGATAVDFAYGVHSDIGNRAVGARINGEPQPLSALLRNGDRVEIQVEPNAKPSPAWLSFVATGKARSHIRHYLRTREFDESVEVGELLLVQALRAAGADPNAIDKADWKRYLKGDSAKNREEVLAEIGLGKRLAYVVARKLARLEFKADDAQSTAEPVRIRGTEGVAVQLSPCCRPIPGDPIVAQIKKGQGLIVHTHDCPAIRGHRPDPEKWVDVQWDASGDLRERLYDVDVRLIATNERGVLAKLAAEIASADANIEHIEIEDKAADAFTTLAFTLQVRDRMHLALVMKRLRRLPEVVRATRIKRSLTHAKQHHAEDLRQH